MTFAVPCPHCHRSNDDPFDVMARGDIDWTHCSWCTRRFLFLIAECKACEEESVFTWPEAPLPLEIKALRCRACDLPIGLRNESTSCGHHGRS